MNLDTSRQRNEPTDAHGATSRRLDTMAGEMASLRASHRVLAMRLEASQRWRRRVLTATAVGCMMLPIAATAITLPTDQPAPQTPIEVEAVWANFEALEAGVNELESAGVDFGAAVSALETASVTLEARVTSLEALVPTTVSRSQSSGSFDVQGTGGALLPADFDVVPGLTVDDVTVAAGHVRLELAPSGTSESYLRAETPDSAVDVRLHIRFERSPAGADNWTTVGLVTLGGANSSFTRLFVPPNACAVIDQPGAGEFSYRVSAAAKVGSGGGASYNGHLLNVALLVQTIPSAM